MNIEEIGKHYISVIVPSTSFTSEKSCDREDLLYKPFGMMVARMFIEYMELNLDNDVPCFSETFRSHRRQSYLYSVGSTGIRGGSILNAGMHNFGLAVDIVNVDDKNNNKKKDVGEKIDWTNLNYSLFRKLSHKYELNFLTWEECHFQAIGVNQQNELRRGVFDYVRKWQRRHGLVADGIVGPKTIAETIKVYGTT